MGGKSSKNNLDIQHLEGLQTTENPEDVERRKMANTTIPDRKKCNTYLPYQEMPKQAGAGDDYETVRTNANPSRAKPSKQQNKRKPRPGDKLVKTLDELGPHKTGEVENNLSKTVEDGNILKEVDGSGAAALYVNLPLQGTDRESQQSTTYENVEVTRDYSGTQGSIVSPDHLDAEADMSIRRSYRELKRRIPVKDVCDHLIQNDVLMQEDCEDIMSDKQLKGADRLLQIILRKDQSAYKDFLHSLRCTGFQDLADELQKPAPTMTGRPWMRTWDKEVILKCWQKIKNLLINELSPQYIIDFFMQENIFSVDEYEVIFRCLGKRMKMAKKLVEIIHQKLPSSLFVLVYALKEIGKRREIFIAKQLETIINDESRLENVPESNREEETVFTVKNKTEPEDACTAKEPSSRDVHYTLKMILKKDGQTVDTLEIEQVINTADIANKLQSLLKSTDCKIISSEHGCVIVHLWPESRNAYQKLSEFCRKGEMKKFVLDLLLEKDIISSIPEGELSIDLKVNYHEEAEEIEETRKPQKDLIQLIKDNRLFLREEIEVQTLITESLENKMLEKLFNDWDITQLKKLLAEDRLEAADFFLTCLLDKDPKKIQSFINKLKGTTKTKIFERLQKSESLYRNSQAIKENILRHYELVVDEIDPCHFEDTFMDREILDNKFFEDLRERQSRRRAQAASFLKEVLNKGSRALFALVDVLREMGCDELVKKLTTFDAKSLKPTQQRKVRVCNDDRKDYVNVEVYHGTAPEVLMWSCCMTVIVEKKQKDEKNADTSDVSNMDKEQICENWQNEEPCYANFFATEVDEGIGEDIVLRLKAEVSQIDRPVTQPEPSFTPESEEKSVKGSTFPLTRGTEREKQSILTQINLVSAFKNDSAIDVTLPIEGIFPKV